MLFPLPSNGAFLLLIHIVALLLRCCSTHAGDCRWYPIAEIRRDDEAKERARLEKILLQQQQQRGGGRSGAGAGGEGEAEQEEEDDVVGLEAVTPRVTGMVGAGVSDRTLLTSGAATGTAAAASPGVGSLIVSPADVDLGCLLLLEAGPMQAAVMISIARALMSNTGTANESAAKQRHAGSGGGVPALAAAGVGASATGARVRGGPPVVYALRPVAMHPPFQQQHHPSSPFAAGAPLHRPVSSAGPSPPFATIASPLSYQHHHHQRQYTGDVDDPTHQRSDLFATFMRAQSFEEQRSKMIDELEHAVQQEAREEEEERITRTRSQENAALTRAAHGQQQQKQKQQQKRSLLQSHVLRGSGARQQHIPRSPVAPPAFAPTATMATTTAAPANVGGSGGESATGAAGFGGGGGGPPTAATTATSGGLSDIVQWVSPADIVSMDAATAVTGLDATPTPASAYYYPSHHHQQEQQLSAQLLPRSFFRPRPRSRAPGGAAAAAAAAGTVVAGGLGEGGDVDGSGGGILAAPLGRSASQLSLTSAGMRRNISHLSLASSTYGGGGGSVVGGGYYHRHPHHHSAPRDITIGIGEDADEEDEAEKAAGVGPGGAGAELLFYQQQRQYQNQQQLQQQLLLYGQPPASQYYYGVSMPLETGATAIASDGGTPFKQYYYDQLQSYGQQQYPWSGVAVRSSEEERAGDGAVVGTRRASSAHTTAGTAGIPGGDGDLNLSRDRGGTVASWRPFDGTSYTPQPQPQHELPPSQQHGSSGGPQRTRSGSSRLQQEQQQQQHRVGRTARLASSSSGAGRGGDDSAAASRGTPWPWSPSSSPAMLFPPVSSSDPVVMLCMERARNIMTHAQVQDSLRFGVLPLPPQVLLAASSAPLPPPPPSSSSASLSSAALALLIAGKQQEKRLVASLCRMARTGRLGCVLAPLVATRRRHVQPPPQPIPRPASAATSPSHEQQQRQAPLPASSPPPRHFTTAAPTTVVDAGQRATPATAEVGSKAVFDLHLTPLSALLCRHRSSLPSLSPLVLIACKQEAVVPVVLRRALVIVQEHDLLGVINDSASAAHMMHMTTGVRGSSTTPSQNKPSEVAVGGSDHRLPFPAADSSSSSASAADSTAAAAVAASLRRRRGFLRFVAQLARSGNVAVDVVVVASVLGTNTEPRPQPDQAGGTGLAFDDAGADTAGSKATATSTTYPPVEPTVSAAAAGLTPRQAVPAAVALDSGAGRTAAFSSAEAAAAPTVPSAATTITAAQLQQMVQRLTFGRRNIGGRSGRRRRSSSSSASAAADDHEPRDRSASSSSTSSTPTTPSLRAEDESEEKDKETPHPRGGGSGTVTVVDINSLFAPTAASEQGDSQPADSTATFNPTPSVVDARVCPIAIASRIVLSRIAAAEASGRPYSMLVASTGPEQLQQQQSIIMQQGAPAHAGAHDETLRSSGNSGGVARRQSAVRIDIPTLPLPGGALPLASDEGRAAMGPQAGQAASGPAPIGAGSGTATSGTPRMPRVTSLPVGLSTAAYAAPQHPAAVSATMAALPSRARSFTAYIASALGLQRPWSAAASVNPRQQQEHAHGHASPSPSPQPRHNPRDGGDGRGGTAADGDGAYACEPRMAEATGADAHPGTTVTGHTGGEAGGYYDGVTASGGYLADGATPPPAVTTLLHRRLKTDAGPRGAVHSAARSRSGTGSMHAPSPPAVTTAATGTGSVPAPAHQQHQQRLPVQQTTLVQLLGPVLAAVWPHQPPHLVTLSVVVP